MLLSANNTDDRVAAYSNWNTLSKPGSSWESPAKAEQCEFTRAETSLAGCVEKDGVLSAASTAGSRALRHLPFSSALLSHCLRPLELAIRWQTVNSLKIHISDPFFQNVLGRPEFRHWRPSRPGGRWPKQMATKNCRSSNRSPNLLLQLPFLLSRRVLHSKQFSMKMTFFRSAGVRIRHSSICKSLLLYQLTLNYNLCHCFLTLACVKKRT